VHFLWFAQHVPPQRASTGNHFSRGNVRILVLFRFSRILKKSGYPSKSAIGDATIAERSVVANTVSANKNNAILSNRILLRMTLYRDRRGNRTLCRPIEIKRPPGVRGTGLPEYHSTPVSLVFHTFFETLFRPKS
jgi:hypothetical protein